MINIFIWMFTNKMRNSIIWVGKRNDRVVIIKSLFYKWVKMGAWGGAIKDLKKVDQSISKLKADILNCRISDDSYRKEYPPINATAYQRTQVFVNLTIISVGPFSELDMNFKVKFLIQVFGFLSRTVSNHSNNILHSSLALQILWHCHLNGLNGS